MVDCCFKMIKRSGRCGVGGNMRNVWHWRREWFDKKNATFIPCAALLLWNKITFVISLFCKCIQGFGESFFTVLYWNMFVQEGLNWQLCLFSLHSFSISQFLCFVFSFQIYWKVWASKRFLEKQEYLCVQHFLSSQSEWAGYCQRRIFLPLIPIRHVPSRSKGCLSDT